MRFPNSITRTKQGFTLVEAFVSIAVIGLLVAITLPAVQSARESARKMDCRNHMKQLALASLEHLDSHGNLGMPQINSEPWKVRILPYLEQVKPTIQSNGIAIGGPDKVPFFRCPSDPMSHGKVLSADGHNYFANDGSGPFASDGLYRQLNGDPILPRDITDGMSNTAMICERRALLDVSIFGGDFSNESLWFHRIVRKTASFESDIDIFADICEWNSIPPLVTQYIENSYNSIQTPNRNSCRNGDTSDPKSGLHAAITASSLHFGGVNLAMADGSVRFVSDSIDRTVWRAIGTRNGNEAVGDF